MQSNFPVSIVEMESLPESPESRRHFCVSVVGAASSSSGHELIDCSPFAEGRSTGIGKSSLCARFVHPAHDDYVEATRRDSSVLSKEDFDKLTSIPPHCVCHGPVVKRVAGKWVAFQLVEHTTLRDEQRQEHPLCNSYVERATSLALSGLPVRAHSVVRASEQRSDAGERSPRGRSATNVNDVPVALTVGGFVLVLDTTRRGADEDAQLAYLDGISGKVFAEGKDAVLALTKCDAVLPERLQQLLVKIQQQDHLRDLLRFQVSALVGVGVGDVFFGLYRRATSGSSLALSSLPYAVSSEAQSEASALAINHYKAFLRLNQNDTSVTWEGFIRDICSSSANDIRSLAALCVLKGRDFCRRAFLERLIQLKYGELLTETGYTNMKGEQEKLRQACHGHPDLGVEGRLDELLESW